MKERISGKWSMLARERERVGGEREGWGRGIERQRLREREEERV